MSRKPGVTFTSPRCSKTKHNRPETISDSNAPPKCAYTQSKGKHNIHDIIVVGVPLLAILGGILFNNHALDLLRRDLKETKHELRGEIKDIRSEIRDVRAEIKDVRNEVLDIRKDITSLRSEMHREFEQFYRTLGQHDAKIEILEKQR
jgi:predicted RNase H-like nuclease (RuvC/YqgF family)